MGSSPFQSGTRGPAILLARHNVSPPAALLLSADDSILVQVWNSSSGQSLSVDYRLLLPIGVIVPAREVIRPSSDRLVNAFHIRTNEGFLLSLAINTLTSGTKPGETFARAQLFRGRTTSTAEQFGQLLTSGYVSAQNSLGWPPGKLEGSLDTRVATRAITGTDPAAGVEISETVPTNARWRLVAFRFVFTTSATVATRTVQLEFRNAGVPVLFINSVASQTAGLIHEYIYFIGAPYALDVLGGDHLAPLPEGAWLGAGDRIDTNTSNLQAGDNFEAPRLVVEEWIEG